MLRCDCIQRVVASPMSSSVTRLVCVYQLSTDVMAATSVETRPTKSTAVSHAQISLDLRVIGNGSVPIQLAYISHARTVVRECCKGDDESQWERVKFDPPPPKNPLTDGHQNLHT